jgi:hypothetical protein
MQDWLPAGWLAFAGRESNPLNRFERFQFYITFPLSRAYPDASWSHARRYFVDAVKLNKQDAALIRALQLMDKLFAIEAQAREENMDHAASWPRQLDPYRQRAGRATDSSHPLCGGKLSTTQDPYPQLPADILPGLANASVQRIADITPVAWAAKHP